MKPLIILFVTFVTAAMAIKILRGNLDLALSGRIAMAVMLLFTAMGHFAFTEGMSMMIPDFIPNKRELVYLTGIFEIMAAMGLLIPRLTVITGWFLIIFFILVLPSNIYAALQHVDYQTATTQGAGPDYLWFRVPLQVVFILWVYLSSIKPMNFSPAAI